MGDLLDTVLHSDSRRLVVPPCFQTVGSANLTFGLQTRDQCGFASNLGKKAIKVYFEIRLKF